MHANDLFDLAEPVNDEGRPVAEPTQVKEHEDACLQDSTPVESGLGHLPDGLQVDADGWIAYADHPLIKGARLSPEHWRELVNGSGIEPGLVLARGYLTVADTDANRRFLRKQGITPKAQEPEHFPGLFLPMYAPGDEGLTFQWKPATPWANGDGKEQKYVSRLGAPTRLDVNPLRRKLLADLDRRLWITEGVKKADALASRGELVIALTGVWNWKDKQHGTVPDWEEIPLAQAGRGGRPPAGRSRTGERGP